MKKLLKISSVLAITMGIVLATGSVWGIYFTYRNVAQEKIVTPSDASIPESPVRGPWTLKSQADIIRTHTLKMTGGKTFAEMPRQIPKLDEKGNSVLDTEGKPVMVTNTARDIWITATTLITALNLGIIVYVFFSFVLLFGLFSVWIGGVFWVLSRNYQVERHN
ncbi:MAG: hypothetical protein A2846_02355 [Candidatus Doudnabacteria bacterium RIFCSPHIGHO2_01_FULL_49_9]|uniref:Uncharacterized protein n=1 Tax=Candidatus Doudnabacteria bacterium RIFCSPHIGHO2_01_FULL_49_9 TaxID=1817827 RepID=A0A1F5P3P0_9BACT|nr:MAG: hypothetical protein A2846_02355 [Candidatus Doudnabacteria bacterium RIFCSPHIGHO2_01_FULL_49_9]